MYFLKWAFALLPLLASAEVELSREEKLRELAEYDYNAHIFNTSYVTHGVPTAAQLGAAYPEHDFLDNRDGTLRVVHRNTNVTIHAQTIPWRITGASLGVIGYYAYYGYERWEKVADSCEANGRTSLRCINQAAAAGVAHAIPGIVGFVGGHAFCSRFWAQAVETGGGVLTGMGKRDALSSTAHLAARETCTPLEPFDNPHRFTGTNELKISVRNVCYTPAVGDLSETQDIIFRATELWRMSEASDIQFTMFKFSSSVILGRFDVRISDQNSATCPTEITGGDSCVCQNCADEFN